MVRRIAKHQAYKLKWFRHRTKTEAAELVAKWLNNPFVVEVIVERPRRQDGVCTLKRKVFPQRPDYIEKAKRIIDRPDIIEADFGIGWLNEHKRYSRPPIKVEAYINDFLDQINMLQVLKRRINKTQGERRLKLIDQHDTLVQKLSARKGKIPTRFQGIVRPWGTRPDGAE